MANITREKMVDFIPGAPRVEVVYPIQDNDNCYQGLFLTFDTSHQVGTFSTSERVAGICAETKKNVDENHAASRPGYDVKVYVDCWARWKISGITQADRGRAVFAGDDNNSVSLTPRARGFLGHIVSVEEGKAIAVIHFHNVGEDVWYTFADLDDDETLNLPDAQSARVRLQAGGEYAEYFVSTVGALTGISTSATSAVTIPQSGVVSLGKPDAASTSGAADQYDLTGGNGSMANLVQPDYARNVVINFTDADTGISAFTVTVNGTDCDGNAQSEVFVFADGLDQTGDKAFATITSIVLTNLTGAGAGDTLDVGYGIKFGVPMNGGDNFAVSKLIVDGANDAVKAEDADNGTFTPTTAPNGSKEVICYYTYDRDVTPTVTVTGGAAGSTNTAATDSDGNLCLYDGGTYAIVKNRLGDAKRVHVWYEGAPTA